MPSPPSKRIAKDSISERDTSSKRRFLSDDATDRNVCHGGESISATDTVFDGNSTARHSPFRLKRRIVGHDAGGKPRCWIDDSVCNLCHQFVRSFLREQNYECKKTKWRMLHFPEYDPESHRAVFRHYATTRRLLESVSGGCRFCKIIMNSTHFSNDCEIVLTEVTSVIPLIDKYGRSRFCLDRGNRFTVVPLNAIDRSTELPLNHDSFEFVLAKDEEECRRSPAAEFERYPWRSSNSEQCFKQLQSWLEECCHTHEECARTFTYIPKRLLDVGPEETLPDFVQLRDTTDHLRVPEAYVALSYCWGSALNITTNRANIQDHMKGIPLEKLPSVVKDAITVTKKLGIRYLWIDAFCICQDDSSEWLSEAENMSSVYGGARLTISAMASSQMSEGFLCSRNLDIVRIGQTKVSYGTRFETLGIFLRRIPRSILDDLRNCKLNNRAWALQERILSPSVVHFCPDQMIWECNTRSLVSETQLCITPGDDVIRLSDAVIIKDSRGQEDVWKCIANMYMCRDITILEDRLHAISGIVTGLRTRGVRQGRHVAGFWETDLDFQLAWKMQQGRFISGQKPRADLDIPTWSWARWNSPATIIERIYMTSALVEASAFEFEDREDDRLSITVGKLVKSAYVRLNGYLQHINNGTIWTEFYYTEDTTGWPNYDCHHGYDFTWYFDHMLSRNRDYFCLRLLEDSRNQSYCIVYLVLEEASACTRQLAKRLDGPLYRRVGILEWKNLEESENKPFVKPYPDVLLENGKPLLTGGRYEQIYLI